MDTLEKDLDGEDEGEDLDTEFNAFLPLPNGFASDLDKPFYESQITEESDFTDLDVLSPIRVL